MANPDITGMDDFLKYLDDSPKKMQQGLGAGLYAGALLIESAAKANCPVSSGDLQASIRATVKEVGSTVIASVIAGGVTPSGKTITYAHLVEFSGAAPHVITGKDGGPISFAGRSFEQVSHPGMQAHPFLRPALDTNEVAAIGLADEAIDAVLKN